MCMYVARVCVYRADLEAECEWLNSYNKFSASAEVIQAKLKSYGDLCSQGDSFGQFLLGYCYYWGFGVDIDWKRAAELSTLSAEQGNAWGQYRLGECYYGGWGVSQDYKRAVELFTLSAEQGNAEGQHRLGWCYYHGGGVTKNRDLARQWWKRAAAQGHEDAKSNLKSYFNE